MTLQVVAGFLGQVGLQHPANLYRNFAGALAGKRTGAMRYNDFAITPSGVAMSISVAAGDAVIMGTEAVSTQGGYYVWNNAAETIAFPAAAGSPRYDSLIMRVVDTDYGVDALGSKAMWEVVSGTPGGSPVPVADSVFAPAGANYHPGAWWRVADILVPASVTNLSTATVVHKRKYARVGRNTMVLAADLPADAQLGDTVTIIDGSDAGTQMLYNGSAWVQTSSRAYVDYTPTFYSNATAGTAIAGGSVVVTYARYRLEGKMCHYYGHAQINTTTAGGVGVSLPFNTTVRRFDFNAYLRGPSGYTTSFGGGHTPPISAPFNRIYVVSNTNAALNIAASGDTIHWNFVYEIA